MVAGPHGALGAGVGLGDGRKTAFPDPLKYEYLDNRI